VDGKRFDFYKNRSTFLIMQTYKVTVDENKNIRWFNDKGELHRLDGPAVEYADGDKVWYVDGKRHRLDGPAVEYDDGSKEWWVDCKRHRLDGPAVEYADGFKAWYVNDKLHRLDGPAIERANGFKEWYVDGKEMTEEEFDKYIKPKPSCEGKVVEVDGVKYKLVKA
jgi:hypothetical protein